MLEKINNKTAPKEVVNALVTLYHQGKFEEILIQENKLINLYTDSVDLHNIFGSTNLALNQFKSAIGNFKKAIKINPNLPVIYYNLVPTYLLWLGGWATPGRMLGGDSPLSGG